MRLGVHNALDWRPVLADSGPSAVEVLGATKATTPPTLTQANEGNTLVVPVPAEAIVGGRLVSVVQGVSGAGQWTPPEGWTLLESASIERWRVETRVVEAGDPSSYTWTYSQQNHSRSGAMIALSPCSVGDSGHVDDDSSPFVFGDVAAMEPGSLFVGLIGLVLDSHASESYVASAPLAIQTQHVARGDRAYQAAVSTAIVTEPDVSGVVTGRQVSNPDTTGGNLLSLILEPA